MVAGDCVLGLLSAGKIRPLKAMPMYMAVFTRSPSAYLLHVFQSLEEVVHFHPHPLATHERAERKREARSKGDKEYGFRGSDRRRVPRRPFISWLAYASGSLQRDGHSSRAKC